MAGISTKEIRNRIRSMASTRQITRAMELSSAAKLRKAQARLAASRPYFEALRSTAQAVVDSCPDCDSPYLVQRSGKRRLQIVIAGDRGLAGGYNSSILVLAEREIAGTEACVLPIGKKAAEFFHRRGIPVLSHRYAEAAALDIDGCLSIAGELSRRYLAGEFDEIHVIYTDFVSALSQTPATLPLLPLTPSGRGRDMLFEPGSGAVLDAVVPAYLGGILYGALCESRAAEAAARRAAMDAATQNADEMIGQLSLQFNRARQSAITQEITEIVAGS